MKKLAGFLIIILLFAYTPIYSIWPIDYSSKTADILILLGNLQITVLETLSHIISILLPLLLNLLDLIGVLVLQLIGFLLSLPYENINLWYVLLGLFITSYFLEKFRTINNEISKLNKKILRQSSSVNTGVDYSVDINKLNNKADSIMKLLEEINSAADIFKSRSLRSKKSRRESLADSNMETILPSSSNDTESLTSEQDKAANKVNVADEIINDENISQIDLARALIASSETEDARNLLKRIVENSSEDQKHEARLLFMQIK